MVAVTSFISNTGETEGKFHSSSVKSLVNLFALKKY